MNWLRILLGVVVLSAVVVALNAPTWDYGFVYDDHAVVLQRDPAWDQGWAKFFTTRQWGTGRHALALSLDLNRTDPPSARPFHVVNTAIAALVAALVFALGVALGLSTPAAWAGALLFAVHPVHVDAVVSIVGRAELLAAVSVLGCVLLHINRYPLPALSLPFSAVLFLIGLGSKESALALPLILACYDLLFARFGREAQSRPRLAFAYALYAVAAGGWAALTYPLLGELDVIAYVDNPIASLPPPERALRAAAVLWRYVGITIMPAWLKADRSFATTDPSLRAGLAATGAWLVLGLLCWRFRRRYPRFVFLVLWFPAAFAVTSNVIIPIGTIMAERLLYLPSVGIVLLTMVGLERVARSGRLGRIAATLAVVMIGVVFAFAYDARGRLWINDTQYHMVATLDSPRSAKAHYDRGLFLAREKNFEGAQAEFRRALGIYPAFSRAAYYMASTFLLLDRPEDAADVYVTYLEADPTDAGVLSQLATIQLGLDRFADARLTAERLVALEPGNPEYQALLQFVDNAILKAREAQSLNASSSSGKR